MNSCWIQRAPVHLLKECCSDICLFYLLVPSSNATCLDIRSRTTYDRHYNDNAGAVADQIRDTNRRLEREALMASVERARNEGEF